MTSTTNDIYDILTKKSNITDNYSTLTHDQVNNNMMIPCGDLYNYYNDSLFYLHLYNSLYLEVFNRNQLDNYDVEKFKNGVEKLTIKIDTSSSCGSKMGTLTIDTATQGYIYTINTTCFKSHYNNSTKYEFPASSPTIDYDVNVTGVGSNGVIRFTLNVATGTVSASVQGGGSGYTTVPTVTSPITGYTPGTITVVNGTITSIGAGSGGRISRNNLLAPQLVNLHVSGMPAINTDMVQGNAVNGIYAYTKTVNNAELSVGLDTRYTTFSLDARKQKFRRVLYQILNTPAENFISYLFYNRVYYNVVVCNSSIQALIRDSYLNNNTLNMSDTANFGSNAGLATIGTYISNMKLNLDNLQTSIDFITNDFIKDKSKYGDKIILLNNTREEYYKIETALNRIIKDYNTYLANYQRIKIYASAVIVFLVLLIIALIAITLLPFFNYNSKNTFYIVILIILIVMLAIYYSNFSHVGVYEKFNCSSVNTYNPLHTDIQTRNNHLTNNYNFFNTIIDYLNNYNNSYSDLNDKLSASVFVGNNKTYSEDANTYLYRLYIDKKRRTEINRMKKISLTNHIEAMKKQIVYLFNIILLICFLTIVLVITLILYTSAPFYLNYIIAFAVIAIILIMVFFIFSMTQPTRMKSNKNYWANKNPTDETINNI